MCTEISTYGTGKSTMHGFERIQWRQLVFTFEIAKMKWVCFQKVKSSSVALLKSWKKNIRKKLLLYDIFNLSSCGKTECIIWAKEIDHEQNLTLKSRNESYTEWTFTNTRHFIFFFFCDLFVSPRVWLHKIYLSDIVENFGPVPEFKFWSVITEKQMSGINT